MIKCVYLQKGAVMTDKELRRLKRTDLLEIMFYLRDEIDELKKENESLKYRIDELSKAAMNAKTEISDSSVLRIADAVRNIVSESTTENTVQHED